MKFIEQNKIQLCIYFAMTSWQQINQFKLIIHNQKDQFFF